MDGDIDYSQFSRAQLEEALTRIEPTRFPRNYENLRRELATRAPEPQRERGPPAIAVLVGCYAGAFVLLQGLALFLFGSALVVIFGVPSELTHRAMLVNFAVFAVVAVGTFFHLARNFPGQFAKVAVGVAVVISGLSAINAIAARLGLF
jgi:hypothetical protein